MDAGQRYDVLIVTAIREEYAAVRAVSAGAVPGSTWEPRTGANGLEVSTRRFRAADGGELLIAVTQALGMGGVEAVSACAHLAAVHRVRCLAMCGVCAGRRGDVALGDVVIAERMWTYDTGKLKAGTDAEGEPTEEDRGDIEMYRLQPPAWKQAAERFTVDPAAEWLSARPRSYEAQGDWILERVLHGHDPATDADGKAKCPDFGRVVERLWKKELLRDGSLALTKAGRARIKRVLLQNRGTLPEPSPFRTPVGPMASGNRVVEDPQIFERLSTSVRKILALEMEAAAVGGLGWARGIEHVVVMKGVMDHADHEKNDNFKGFAARASAECLIQFLRENLRSVGEAEDPILMRETRPPPPKMGPAGLLQARHQVVGFLGREALLGSLRAWCEKEGRAAVRLIHAAGGMGKTRLAVELCKRMRADAGWRVGFVPGSLGADRFATLIESDRDVLAVVDYAEGRAQLREMLEVLAARRGEADRTRKKLRVLLLSRNADAWWADLQRSDSSVRELLYEDPVALLAVDVDRGAMFREAVPAFAAALGTEAAGVAMPGLVDKAFERVLYVQMAALAAVEGREVAADRLMEETLDHEEQFWRAQLHERGPAGVRVALPMMRRAVAALTLLGGAGTEAEARALVEDEKRDEMVLLLRDLYPGSGGRYLDGLEPDLLGEAMVRRVLSAEGDGARVYLDRVFEGAVGQSLRTGFGVLGRLSDSYREADVWIAHVLGRDVEGRALEALRAAKDVGERTAFSGLGRMLAEVLENEGTVEVAATLERELPHPDRTVSLRDVGRWVLETRMKHLPLEDEDTDEKRAQILNDLSVWQRALGQREAALASSRESVDICRRLAVVWPDEFSSRLALGLNSLGIAQNELGQYEDSIISTQEAVAIYRRLADAHPDKFGRSLAMSLNNLSIGQRHIGQEEVALVSASETVDIYRRLADVQPDLFLPYLATSLSTLGRMQVAVGKRDEALESNLEAVTVRRRLARARPDAYLPDLARSLHNLGGVQSQLGQREAAVLSTDEAVAIRRQLAGTRPEVFLPDLAMSLSNLGGMQVEVAQHEQALATTEEAVSLYRSLAAGHPEVFRHDLAMSLLNLGKTHWALGDWKSALVPTLEAEVIYRQLVGSHSEAFLADLAQSLSNLGAMQASVGELGAALVSAQEAVFIGRRLVESRGEVFVLNLVQGLTNVSFVLYQLGRTSEALSLAEEALDLVWPAYERSPESCKDLVGAVLRGTVRLFEAVGKAPGEQWTQRLTRYLTLSSS